MNFFQSTSADLEQEILQFLDGRNRPVKPHVIAKGVGLQKAMDVNPVLYKLESDGLLKKTHEQPPKWVLVSNSHIKEDVPSSPGDVMLN